MSDATITYVVLAAAVVLFVWDRLPVALVALGVALALWATGVLPLDRALAGFGDPTVLFIAALFVVSGALEASGVTSWAGQQLIARVGTNRTRVLVLMLSLVAVVTAFINVNASVAALLPVVVQVAMRLRWRPSQLLLPLAFGAHAGSLLALTGTPVHVLVNDAAADAGVEGFGYFAFALVGMPVLIATIAMIVLLGERLLPHRDPPSVARDFTQHARTLVEHYALEHAPEELFTRTAGVAEVVIPPRSGLVGQMVCAGSVSERSDIAVLAVQRDGEEITGPTQLAVGDSLLLLGPWAALDRRVAAPDLLAVDDPALVRRQAVPMGTGAKRAIGVLLVMIVLLTTGVLPAAAVGLLAAAALVVLGVLSVEQAYESVAWNTVVLVAGMMALSSAMIATGAAEQLAEILVAVVGDAGPYALLLGLFVLVAVLGQLISNMATALIVIPIALTAAAEMGISPRPVLMSLTVSAAAAFLTPVATPANLMVMGPGAYRFGDYWKLGLPLLLLFGVAAVLLVPVFWPF